jgi:hypothetical protein
MTDSAKTAEYADEVAPARVGPVLNFLEQKGREVLIAEGLL